MNKQHVWIDKQWFLDKQRDMKMSGSEFARRIGLGNRSQWSRTLNGERRLKQEELVRIASLLGMTVNDVLPHVVPVGPVALAGAGGHSTIAETPDGAPGRATAGVVDAGQGEVTFAPGGLQGDQVALAVIGDPWMAGWVVVCEPSAVSATPSEDQEAGIVRLRDGRMLLRKIRAGFLPGTFDLGPFLGFGAQENGVEIVGVIPVVAIRRG